MKQILIRLTISRANIYSNVVHKTHNTTGFGHVVGPEKEGSTVVRETSVEECLWPPVS